MFKVFLLCPSATPHVADPPTETKLLTWAKLGIPDLKGHLSSVREIQVPLVRDYNSGVHTWQGLGSLLSLDRSLSCASEIQDFCVSAGAMDFRALFEYPPPPSAQLCRASVLQASAENTIS